MAEANYLPGYKNRTGDSRVVVMDFRRPDKFSMEQIKTMAMIHENFARLATVKLSAMFHQKAELHLSSVDQYTYNEFTSQYAEEEPATFAVLGNRKIRSSALLVLNNRLSYLVQARSYGQQEPDEGNFKGFSNLSIGLVQRIISEILVPLNSAWEGIGDFPFYLQSLEHNILFTQILPPSEMIILMSWDVSFFGEMHKMELCIPYLFMEPIMSRLSLMNYFGPSGKIMQNLGKPEFNKVKIPSAIECNCANISLNNLMTLKKGDIIAVEGLDDGEAFLKWGERRIEKLEVLKGLKGFNIIREQDSKNIPLRDLLTGKKDNSSDLKLDLLISKINKLSQSFDRRIEELNQGQDLLNDQILLNETPPPSDVADFDFISTGDIEFINDLLSTEPFQLNALILSLLPPQTAAGYLELFDTEEQAELCERISRIDVIEPRIAVLVSDYLKERIRNYGDNGSIISSGVLKTAEILQHSRRSLESSVIDCLEHSYPETAKILKENMFVMEDLVLFTKESLSTVAKIAETRDLGLGLKPLNDEIREQIIAKLPTDAQQKLKPLLESGRPYRLGMLEDAQHRVISLVREMEKSGLLFLEEEEF